MAKKNLNRGGGEIMKNEAFFGKVNIHNKTTNYRSRNWTEVSKSVNIAMYTTVPGTMKSVEYPSVTLEFEGLGLIGDICPDCNLPMNEHELREEYIKKIKRREKNKPIKIKNIDGLKVNQ
jgi:hypothetical protein